LNIISKIFEKKYKKSDLYIGTVKKLLSNREYEDVTFIFIKKGNVYIDIFSGVAYDIFFINENSLDRQNESYIVEISKINCFPNEKIALNELRQIFIDVKKETEKLKLQEDLYEIRDRGLSKVLESVWEMVPFEQNQFKKRLMGITITYINPYHPDIDANISIIKNADEILSLRTTKEMGRLLEGVVYNETIKYIDSEDDIFKDSSYISATYNSEPTLDEPEVSKIHRKILHNGRNI